MTDHDRRTYADRGGFALPAAIGALVIIGILVTAGFYMARQELRIGVASNHANMAVNFAQAGANEVMANWNGYQLNNIAVWSDTTITDTLDTGIWSVSIAKTSDHMFYLSATGEVTQGGDMWSGSSRTIGIVTKLLFADINPPAALMTMGGVKVAGGAEITGMDEDPAGWGGYCGPNNDLPGLVIDEADNIDDPGGGITGTPPYEEDPSLVLENFTTFGDMDWAELTSLAQLEGKDVSGSANINNPGPVVTGGVCDTSVLRNWGDPSDPTAPCGGYFPLIYHSGPSLTVQSGGVGQGVLLVDGDLDLRGGFTFHGIIIIQGTFSTQGGETVYGAVMAGNAEVDDQAMVGTSAIQYSSCGVRRALLNNASLSRARPLDQRSWVDLSAVVN